MSTKLAMDICERVLTAFALVFLAVWLAAPSADLFDVGLLRAAAVAGIAAAAETVRGLLASRVGDKDTAALLPAS